MVGAGEQRLHQHPEQPKEDGHLDHQRPQAPHWADPSLSVQPHRLLGNPGPVPPVALLDFPHPRLKVAHRPHLP